jgi:hypothetical protein
MDSFGVAVVRWVFQRFRVCLNVRTDFGARDFLAEIEFLKSMSESEELRFQIPEATISFGAIQKWCTSFVLGPAKDHFQEPTALSTGQDI